MDVLLLLGLLGAGILGAAIGKLARFPFWPLSGAILGAAAFHLAAGGAASVPWWWSFGAQVLIGTVVGAKLGPAVLRDFRLVLLPGTVAVLAIVAAGVGLGFALESVSALSRLEAVFGMVPGGVGEMVAAVTTLHGNSALVAGMHLVRLLIVIVSLPWLVRLVRRLT
ncbi:MAG: AbrB family transcriptional regulator [Pseudonocardiaceae bacterium]|nr:AbrB family transcriptional regulator [Pseudonocardiaceae bacterium]